MSIGSLEGRTATDVKTLVLEANVFPVFVITASIRIGLSASSVSTRIVLIPTQARWSRRLALMLSSNASLTLPRALFHGKPALVQHSLYRISDPVRLRNEPFGLLSSLFAASMQHIDLERSGCSVEECSNGNNDTGQHQCLIVKRRLFPLLKKSHALCAFGIVSGLAGCFFLMLLMVFSEANASNLRVFYAQLAVPSIHDGPYRASCAAGDSYYLCSMLS